MDGKYHLHAAVQLCTHAPARRNYGVNVGGKTTDMWAEAQNAMLCKHHKQRYVVHAVLCTQAGGSVTQCKRCMQCYVHELEALLFSACSYAYEPQAALCSAFSALCTS
eukprot:1158222-Pelagomonas_calceolata.AAC.2